MAVIVGADGQMSIVPTDGWYPSEEIMINNLTGEETFSPRYKNYLNTDMILEAIYSWIH